MIKLPKLRSLKEDTSGIMALVMLAVGLLIILIVWQIIPLVNSNIGSAVVLPGCDNPTGAGEGVECRAGYEWNATIENNSLVNSSNIFTATGGIFKVVIIVALIAILLAYLFSVIPKGGQGSGGL